MFQINQKQASQTYSHQRPTAAALSCQRFSSFPKQTFHSEPCCECFHVEKDLILSDCVSIICSIIILDWLIFSFSSSCSFLFHPCPCSLNPSTSPETTISFTLMVFEVTTSSGWEPCLPRALKTSRRQSCRLRWILLCWKQKLQMDWQKPRGTREQQRGDIVLVTRTRRAALHQLSNWTENSFSDSVCLRSAV